MRAGWVTCGHMTASELMWRVWTYKRRRNSGVPAQEGGNPGARLTRTKRVCSGLSDSGREPPTVEAGMAGAWGGHPLPPYIDPTVLEENGCPGYSADTRSRREHDEHYPSPMRMRHAPQRGTCRILCLKLKLESEWCRRCPEFSPPDRPSGTAPGRTPAKQQAPSSCCTAP